MKSIKTCEHRKQKTFQRGRRNVKKPGNERRIKCADGTKNMEEKQWLQIGKNNRKLEKTDAKKAVE